MGNNVIFPTGIVGSKLSCRGNKAISPRDRQGKHFPVNSLLLVLHVFVTNIPIKADQSKC